MLTKFSLTRFILDSTDTIGELLVVYTMLVLITASVFSYAEGLSLWDSIWWAVVTSTSTGFGDFYPKTVLGRIDGIILMVTSIFVIIPLIVTRLVQTIIADRNAFTHEEQEGLKTDVTALRNQVNSLLTKLDKAA